MSRLHRPNIVVQTFTVAAGATDQNNPVDALVPGPGATLLEAAYTTKTAGTGTGTFSVRVKAGATDFLGVASATTFIDADAAAGVHHGVQAALNAPVGTGTAVEGARLGITTVKAGTVSADATLIVQLKWQL